MTAKLTIALSDEVLDALKASRAITIRLESAGGRPGRRAAAPAKAPRGRKPKGGMQQPRAGSLPARVIDWASGRTRPFGTKDLVKKFKLSRAHASMLLSRLASGPYPINRERRGVYSSAK